MTTTDERAHSVARTYGEVTWVVLIGGGDLMVEVAEICRQRRLSVSAALAPRHAEESLLLREDSLPELHDYAMEWVDKGLAKCVEPNLSEPRS